MTNDSKVNVGELLQSEGRLLVRLSSAEHRARECTLVPLWAAVDFAADGKVVDLEILMLGGSLGQHAVDSMRDVLLRPSMSYDSDADALTVRRAGGSFHRTSQVDCVAHVLSDGVVWGIEVPDLQTEVTMDQIRAAKPRPCNPTHA